MKKFKCTNVLKRIIISILCVITIALAMPAKVKAGPLQDFVELFMNIPDAIMILENDYIAQRNGQTYKTVNLKGIEIGGSDEGKIFNFMVTPYEIISNGKVETYKCADGKTEKKVINVPLLNANFFSTTDDMNQNVPGTWEIGSGNQTKSNDILRKPIGRVYKTLRNFCMILMMLVLLYIGIKIMISSSAEQQSKYKKNLVDWLVGFCLLFVMHYFMVFIATVNDLVVDMLADGDSQEFYISLPEIEGDPGASYIENLKKILKERFDADVDAMDVMTAFSFIFNPTTTAVTTSEVASAIGSYEAVMTSWENHVELDTKTGNIFSDLHLALPEGGGYFDKSSTRVVVPNRDWGDNGTVQLNAEIFKDFNTRRACIYKANIVEYVRTISSIGPQNTFVFTKDDKVTALNGRMLDDDLTKIEYGIFYIALVVQTLMFLTIYIKRLIQLAFLTMIAPFVAMMYPVDKIGDGQAQSFNAWLKDYFFGVLLQPIHLLLYAIFITAASELFTGNNIIYAIAVYAYMIPAEKYIKKIFGFEKAGGGGPAGGGLAGALGHGAAMDLLNKGAGVGPGSWGGSNGGKGNGGDSKGKGVRKNRNVPDDRGGAPAGSGSDGGGIPAASGLGSKRSSKKKGGGGSSPILTGNTDRPGADGDNKKKSGFGGLLEAFGNAARRKTIKGATGQYSEPYVGAKAIGAAVGKRVLKGGVRGAGMVIGAGAGFMLGTANALANGNFDPSQIAAATYTGLKAGDKWANAGIGAVEDFADEVDSERLKVDEEYQNERRRQEALERFSDDLSEIKDDDERQQYIDLINKFSPYEDIDDMHDLKALKIAYDTETVTNQDGNKSIKATLDSYKRAKNWRGVNFSTGATAEQEEKFKSQFLPSQEELQRLEDDIMEKRRIWEGYGDQDSLEKDAAEQAYKDACEARRKAVEKGDVEYARARAMHECWT